MALNQNQKLGLGLAIAAIGFLLWKKFGKKSEAVETPPVEAAKASVQTPTDTGKTEYELKVMKLQGILKVAIDGIAGPQTNTALKAAMPENYANWGAVSATNVDKYLAAFGTQVQNQTDAQKVQAIIAAQGVLQMAKDYTAKELIYDYAEKRYVYTGKTLLFKSGFRFSGWLKAARNVTVIVKQDGATAWWEFPPSVLIVTK